MRLRRRSWEELRLADVLSELVPEYLSAREREIEAVPALLAAGNFERIGLIGQNLTGGGAMFGLPEIGRIGKAIEGAVKDREIDVVLRSVEDLRGVLAGAAAS